MTEKYRSLPRLQWNTLIPSGIFLVGQAEQCLAMFGDETEPRTRCDLMVEARGFGPLHPIPALTSLSDICKSFPKHLVGTGLRLFIKAKWKASDIHSAMSEKDRPLSAGKVSWNALNMALLRERHEMESEASDLQDFRFTWEMRGSPRNNEVLTHVEVPYFHPLADDGTHLSKEVTKLELSDSDPAVDEEEAEMVQALRLFAAPSEVGTEGHWQYVQVALKNGWEGAGLPIEQLEAVAERFGEPAVTDALERVSVEVQDSANMLPSVQVGVASRSDEASTYCAATALNPGVAALSLEQDDSEMSSDTYIRPHRSGVQNLHLVDSRLTSPY